MEEQEIKKLAELRRKEKEDDRKARERVRAQIEADKAARKAKAEAAQGGTPTPIVVAPPVAVPVKPASAPKDYTEARLQVWLSTHPYQYKHTLFTVTWIHLQFYLCFPHR